MTEAVIDALSDKGYNLIIEDAAHGGGSDQNGDASAREGVRGLLPHGGEAGNPADQLSIRYEEMRIA